MGHGSRRPVPPVASNGKHPQHAAFCSAAAYTLSACVQSSIVPNFRCHLTEMKERRPPRACALLCSQDCDALLIPSMYIACLFDSPPPSHTHTPKASPFSCHCTGPCSVDDGITGVQFPSECFGQETFSRDGCFYYCCFLVPVEPLLVQTQTKSHLCFPDS